MKKRVIHINYLNQEKGIEWIWSSSSTMKYIFFDDITFEKKNILIILIFIDVSGSPLSCDFARYDKYAF